MGWKSIVSHGKMIKWKKMIRGVVSCVYECKPKYKIQFFKKQNQDSFR